MNTLDIFLGLMTAAGGFIDISNIVFNPQSAAKFGYALIWPLIVGLIGASLYSEMCGRVAAITNKPVFDLIRERTGFNFGMIALFSSLLLNVLTCAAEVGGVAIILQLFSGFSYYPVLVISIFLFLIATWFMSFKVIEWTYGLLGLCMAIFIATAVAFHPNWQQVALGFMPIVPHLSGSANYLTYAYFIVGLIASALMPYEVYFYSSGGIEEDWKAKDLLTNKLTSYVGFGIGALFAIAISIMSATLYFGHGIYPQLVGSVVLGPALVFGKIGLLITLLGLLFAIAGASVEAALAGAYSVSQFFGWNWGKHQRPGKVPRFTLSWIAIFLLAFGILLCGINPIQLTQYAVIFSVVAFPLTYFPILLVSNDKRYMNQYVNGKFKNVLAWVFLVIILLVAVAAIPLMIITQGGSA